MNYAIRLLLLALSVAALCALLAGTAGAGATSGGASQSNVSALVNNYERTNTFRGIANANLPRTPAEGFRLGIVAMTFPSTNTGVARDGFVDYGSIGTGTRLIAASDGPTRDRFALLLQSARSPRKFSVNVTLPSGSTVANEQSGAITITSPSGKTTLAPARAIDAAGRLVPAHYEISRGKLVIQVRDQHAAFPVMIDPVSAAYWWGTQSWYSRSDVRNFANWYGLTNVAIYACNWMGPLAPLCRKVVGAYTGWISGTWAYAKQTNQCLTMKMTWTGQVIGVNAYGCNWG